MGMMNIRRRIILSNPHIETASGDVASFSTGLTLPVKQLVVGIEPVQSGEGDPYPPGGGKNKYNLPETMSGDYSVSDGVVTISKAYATSGVTIDNFNMSGFNGQTVTISADVMITQDGEDTGRYVRIGMRGTTGSGGYTSNNVRPSSFNSYQRLSSTITIDSDSAYLAIQPNSVDHTVYFKNVQIELGSSATSYAPYSNIRPISGWTGCNVVRTGKNLLDRSTEEMYAIKADGTFGTNELFRHSQLIPVKVGEKYTISLNAVVADQWHRIIQYDQSGNYIDQLFGFLPSSGSYNATVTIPLGTSYIKLSYHLFDENIQFEHGETATAYKTFVGSTTYSITFSVSAGTVYGGTLTIDKDGSGELIVNSAYVDLGDLQWDYVTSGTTYPYFDSIIVNAKGNAEGVCSIYKRDTVSASNSTDKAWWVLLDASRIRIRDNSYSDANTFSAFVSGQKLVYEVKTTRRYSLTASQIRTLMGQNNIFADTGSVSCSFWKQ